MPHSSPLVGNLPGDSTTFVGRRPEMAAIRKRLTSSSLVSLVGPGGVGKTRLAIRAARESRRGFPQGSWLVELADVHDAALLGTAVMGALGLRDQTGTQPAELVLSYLRDKELLLVLDNCEHLLDAAARFVSEVLKAAPAVRIIATSREPLSVAGEHVLPVPPLTLPAPDADQAVDQLLQNEAITLFVERAEAASGEFELTATNRDAVVDLCRRLDGLPLAIELAAVRTRLLTAEQIRDRLDSRFDLLTGGHRGALPRHQTLRATLDWSHELLIPPEQALLRRLSVFAGRFTLEDLEAVCCYDQAAPGLALDLLASLVDKSLVVKEEAATAACYRLHETTKEYARQHLDDAGETDTVEQRSAVYYLSRARAFAVEGRHQLPRWLDWMELEIENLRAVVTRRLDDDPDLCLEIITCLMRYWITRATSEGVLWLDAATARATVAAASPWPHFARGFLGVLQNDPAAASPALERGVTAAKATGHQDALSQCLAMASIAANLGGDRATSRRLLDEARTVTVPHDDLGAKLMVLQATAFNAFLEGDAPVIASAAVEGAAVSRAAGDTYSLEMMLMNQGFAAVLSDEFDEAVEHFTEALQLSRVLDDRVAQCYLLGGLGCCAAGSGHPSRAAQFFGAMDVVRAEAGATINEGLGRALESATPVVTAALSPAEWEASVEKGRHLGRDGAMRLALDESKPAAPQSPVPDAEVALSKRELEVAHLVTEGLSNKAIGARLFISERTAESHVRSTLTKLGFRSRTEIAAWAARSAES